MNGIRFWTAIGILGLATSVLYARPDVDKVPPSEPVTSMPRQIGVWHGKDLPIDQAVLDILGKGDFLNRVYVTDPSGSVQEPEIGLFIGYFPTQRTGQTIHSPQHCLPGAGWTFESSSYNDLTAQNGGKFRVGEYVITNGEQKQFVLYWYQAHGRSVANEYASKFYLIADAMRMNRTDGALVRVITPIASNETTASARQRAVDFTSLMAPQLARFIPA
jgi:EpsI family protein